MCCSGAVLAADQSWELQLCGLWRSTLKQGGFVYEEWRPDSERADRWLGRGWVVDADGREQFAESLVIEHSGSVSHYLAEPQGQTPVRFVEAPTALPQTRRWVNAQHDDPQWIEYRVTADELLTSIGRLDDESQQHARQWRYQRLRACGESS
ncbi:MAG: hypothetical protein Tsb002_12890 [Wenzhouxiangellaceae bacterium]